jgi:dTMP kinase
VPPRGLLIAVEGGEGAGKSTQAARLATSIGGIATREPGGTKLGEQVRGLLLDPAHGEVDPRAELMLMLAARAQHVAKRIEPALVAGTHVVVDRFSASTLAYQGYGRGLPLDEVRQACDLATGGLWPDITILLDLDVATGAERRRHERPDRIESADEGFHERVREGFLALAAAGPETWLVLDGSRRPDEVAAAALAAVRARMKAVGT